MDLRPFIEQTNLKPDLTDKHIDHLVKEAIEHKFFGICVPPFWVKKAARDLKGSEVSLVTVIGFPNGYNRTETKTAEIELAIKDGAKELDIVMNVSAFKTGMPWVKIELAKCSHLIHQSECIMKTIIETSYLSDEEIIKACEICEEAGVDFVKTSTGFSSAGAKVEHIRLMRETLGKQTGIKASGGIKTKEQALAMIEAGADRLGTSSGIQLISE